jgi:hypothetical protein
VEKSTDAIIAQIADEMLAPESIELTLTERSQYLVEIKGRKPDAGIARDRFIATARGQKLYEGRTLSPGPEQTVWQEYSDGTRCASVTHDRSPDGEHQKSITISNDFMREESGGYVMRPEPIRFHYVGLTPLYEAIPGAERTGRSRVAERDCNVFLFRAVPGARSSQDLVYHLDDQTSVPLKVEAFANEARRRADKPSWTWEALTLDEVQGFHVPFKSKRRGYIVSDESPSREKSITDYAIDSVRFNQSFPASTFWPTLEEGVFINDLIEKTSYYNTPDKEAPKSEATIVVDRPAASPAPTSGASYVGAGVVLATAVLAAAIFWKVRRG